MLGIIHRFLPGVAAGLVATVPMTLLMEWWHRRLPRSQQYPLPPSEIVDELADRTGLEVPQDPSRHAAITLAAHFAYGGAAGAPYALVAPRGHVASAAMGGAYGLGVWTLSYLGLLPVLGVLRPATEHPAERTQLMLGAHVVWGLALGFALAQLRRPSISSRSSESGHL